MMQSAILGLLLVLICGAVAAEEASQVKVPSNTPSAKSPPATAKTAPPKGPPAKELFGAITAPTPLAARAIGSYARGCLAGAVSLPINGPDWQVMRLSRNRNWGHPRLLDFLERFASDARALDGWPGLLIGDMAQPRGGPMITGHESHQIGLDADIWLTPMPDRILTPQEREDLTATSMLKDPFTVDMNLWTPLQTKLIKRAASCTRRNRARRARRLLPSTTCRKNVERSSILLESRPRTLGALRHRPPAVLRPTSLLAHRLRA
jgi:penicillin-insensitive murein endopeptidase